MLEPVSENRLPRWVEPRKLVTAAANLKRTVHADDLPRLNELTSEIGLVTVDLYFDRNDQGHPELLGHIYASFKLQCQRCLEPMDFVVDKPIALGIVWDEAQAQALSKTRDPWIVDEDEADLASIIEEEILLAMPVVAKHEEDCLDPSLFTAGDVVEETETKPNPFSVLAALKNTPA